MRWAVRAKDGWHFAKPNRPWKDGENHVKTQCLHIVTLPMGCQQRTTVDCDDCHLAVENKS